MLSACLAAEAEGSIKEVERRNPTALEHAPANLPVEMKASLAVCAVFFAVLVSSMEDDPMGSHPEASDFHETFFQPATKAENENERKVTCEQLNSNARMGAVGHAACAAHCLSKMKGFRGGSCDKEGFCSCKK